MLGIVLLAMIELLLSVYIIEISAYAGTEFVFAL